MKICLDIAHNTINDLGLEYGEGFYLNEIGQCLIENLKAAGHNILVVTPMVAADEEDSLMRRVVAANNFGADLFISIHADDGKSLKEGAAAYTSSEIGKGIANNILTNLSDNGTGIGYRNNGIKGGKGIFVLEKTSMPSILINCFHSDSTNDINLYSSGLGAEFIVNAIADGINDYLEI